MVFGSRWYDSHPRISFAVDCIENASPELRTKIAKVIIKDATGRGIKAKKPMTGLFRRWYDKDEDLSLAMEYFKKANEEQRAAIAEHIVTYIRENQF